MVVDVHRLHLHVPGRIQMPLSGAVHHPLACLTLAHGHFHGLRHLLGLQALAHMRAKPMCSRTAYD